MEGSMTDRSNERDRERRARRQTEEADRGGSQTPARRQREALGPAEGILATQPPERGGREAAQEGASRVTLQRLVLDYRSGELVVRCLYQSDGRSNSGTKARAREVAELARARLRDALEALEGRVDVVGVSGYQVREDILDVALPRSDEASEARAAS
jgi:hypothetical protein